MWTLLAALGVGLALGLWAVRETARHAEEQDAQIAALQAQASAAQDTAEQLCDQVRAMGRVCVQDPAALRGEPGATGPPPSDAQVYAAVELYMSGRQLVSPADLAIAVADYLAEHPPADGADAPPITGEQITAQLATYLTAHPPPAGPPGDPGRAPTAEEILAAVSAWFTANPGPYCATGYAPREVDIPTVADGIVHALICAKTPE